MLASVGAGLLTVKVVVAFPPPGAAFVTVTVREPVPAVEPIVMLAVSCVALSTLVELTVMPDPKLTLVTPSM